MGYTTTFEGSFYFDKPLTQDQIKYLQAFSEKRRCQIKTEAFENMLDPLREKVGLPTGEEGAFCINYPDISWGDGNIIDFNEPPLGQPDLWCKWVPTDDGTQLIWNGREKFYGYIYWLIYMVDNFFLPWGYVLNGEIRYQGEDKDDQGVLIFKKNNLYRKTYKYRIEDYIDEDDEPNCNFIITGENQLECFSQVKNAKLE